MKQEIGALRAHAVEVAERIRQDNTDSPTGPGGFQTKVLDDLRRRGPDPRLQAVEGALASLIIAIDTYLATA